MRVGAGDARRSPPVLLIAITMFRFSRSFRGCLVLHGASAALLLVFSGLLLSRSSAQEGTYDWSKSKALYPGILYTHVESTSPQKTVINCMRVDVQTPGIRFDTTRRCLNWIEGKEETRRRTVRDFIRQSQRTDKKIVVATNGDGFSPWPAPYQKETLTDVGGLLVSNGTIVSRGRGTPSFIMTKSGEVRIEKTSPDADLTDIETAVSGFGLCLIDGQVPASNRDLAPRTGLGLSADRRYVIMMTMDGRQPASAGATTQSVGEWLAHFGAHTGINMDGGGSTTMVWWDPKAPERDKCRLLNSPVGNGVTYDPEKAKAPFHPTERANGSNLGVYFTKK